MPRLRTVHGADPGARPPSSAVYVILWACAVACAAFLARPAFGQNARFAPTSAPTSPAGVRATVDLPVSLHTRNVGGSDGAGLCVFTSIQHSAYWQGVNTLDGFREWMRGYPGGGWPEKVDQMLARFCASKGAPVPDYIQHTGGDDAFLDLAVKTDRMPAVTYDGRDDFYRSFVYHMVSLAHLDGTRAAIIDNNRPGVWLWMSRADFLSRWRGSNGGWAIVLLAPPPPPYSTAPAASRANEWVGTDPPPADFSAGQGCKCDGARPCECGDVCRCRAPVAFGQCGPGGCRVPFAPTPAPDPFAPGPPAPLLALQPAEARPITDTHVWGRFPDGRYGWLLKPDPAPAAAPAVQTTTTGESVPAGGVDPQRIHNAPAYSMTGRPITRDQALAAIGAGGLSDDSDHWHVTAVGDAALCAKVKADVAALPEPVRGKLLVQCYQAGAWPVAAFKLPDGVSLRAPSAGRVAPQLGAVGVAEYTAGTTTLADLLSVAGGPTPATPKVPAPMPGPTPGPTPDTPAPTPAPAPVPAVPTWVYILGAALLLLFARR